MQNVGDTGVSLARNREMSHGGHSSCRGKVQLQAVFLFLVLFPNMCVCVKLLEIKLNFLII